MGDETWDMVRDEGMMENARQKEEVADAQKQMKEHTK